MDDTRPPYGVAALVGLAVLGLYVVTLAPSTAFWDTSEYIATAHILGIPHPPGNPFFVVFARVWSLLLAPLGLSVAVRLNLLAACTSAMASGFLFLVAHRVLSPVFEDRRRALVGASVAALIGATAYTVWNQSNVNEKVYTISVLVIAAVTWLAVRWRDRVREPRSERYLLAALFLMVLGSTNHLMSVLPLPALGVLVLMTDPFVLFRPRFLVRAVLLVVVGLSFNFVLPVRAALDPVINEGDATCEGFVDAATAIYSNGKAGCPALAYNLTRKQYRKPPVTERQAPFSHQIKNYLQYFDWQWSRGADPSELPSWQWSRGEDPVVSPGAARLPLTLIFGGLGLCGLWAAWRADRGVFAYLCVLMGTLSIALVFYLNFRYGYSIAPEVADRALHEVRERDYFFVASFLLWGVLSGTGLAWLWRKLAELSTHANRWSLASPVLVLALIPLALNWSWASRAGDYAARNWAYDLLASVEPYAVLFTNGDNDTFPLWYMQEVEGMRRDVTVIVGQYLGTSWYPKQIADLTEADRQRPFDAGQFPDLYRAPAAAPEQSVLRLGPDQMDQVGGVRLERDFTVPFPGLAVVYPAGMVLDRTEQLALSIIHDTIEERPVYFAARSGLMSQLGLERWGVRHGLAVKLEFRDLDGDVPEGVVRGSPQFGAEYFDLDRSLKLYTDVYRFRSLRDRAIWQDRSTVNIPWHFYVLALQLGDVASQSGADPELVRRLQDDALAFEVVANGGPRGTPDA